MCPHRSCVIRWYDPSRARPQGRHLRHPRATNLRWAVVGVVLAVPMGGGAAGQDTIGLRGEMFLGGAQLVDPPAGGAKDTHAYLAITGPAALRLYRSMPTQEEADLCRGDGHKLKRAGQLACSIDADGREAVCDFAVDLRAGKLAGGRPC